jgi:hypothetical protein
VLGSGSGLRTRNPNRRCIRERGRAAIRADHQKSTVRFQRTNRGV